MAGPKPLENADTPSVRICKNKLVITVIYLFGDNRSLYNNNNNNKHKIICVSIIFH